jgi:hypothetical protein
MRLRSLSTGDRIRLALSPLYLIVGVLVLFRGGRESLTWLLGLSFVAYGVYRLVLIKRALRG